MISTITDRIADILMDSTFIDNLRIAGQAADFELPQLMDVFKHEVESVDQFPVGFVLYDGSPEFEYGTAGGVGVIQHRFYVGIVVQFIDPADIAKAVRGYIDALRPTLNSQIRNGTDIIDGRVVSVERDPIVSNDSGIYTSSFTITVHVWEYAQNESVD